MTNTEPIDLSETRDPVPLDVPGVLVHDGITEVVTCQSRWLFDISTRRYLRCGHWETVEAAMQFGQWRPYERASVEDHQLEVREAMRPAVRTTIHDEGCRCGTTGATGTGSRMRVEAGSAAW